MALLRAAVLAPSATNEQPWLFAVVQDRARLAEYSERAKALLARDGSPRPQLDVVDKPSPDVFYDAGTLVVIATRGRSTWTEADCWLAAENMMLAACGLGLATCPVGFAQGILNTPEVKSELGLPPDASAVAPVVVGYPRSSATTPAVPRREPRVTSWLRGTEALHRHCAT